MTKIQLHFITFISGVRVIESRAMWIADKAASEKHIHNVMFIQL